MKGRILKRIIIGSLIMLILILFGRPILSKILFQVEKWRIVKNYKYNSAEIKSIIEYSKLLNPIEFNISGQNQIKISFSDSTTRNSDMTMHLNYIQLSSTDNKLIEIDKDHNLLLNMSDSTLKYNCWTCNYSGSTNNRNLKTLLNYYGWTPFQLEKLINLVKKANCFGYQKDCIGDIVLNYSIVDLYPNSMYYIPRYRVFNYIITNNCNRYEDTNIEKIDTIIYWWDNQYFFCDPSDKTNYLKTILK